MSNDISKNDSAVERKSGPSNRVSARRAPVLDYLAYGPDPIRKTVNTGVQENTEEKIKVSASLGAHVTVDTASSSDVAPEDQAHRRKGSISTAHLRKRRKTETLNKIKPEVAKGKSAGLGEVKKATFDLPKELHKRLKDFAYFNNVDMVDVVVEALERHLSKY